MPRWGARLPLELIAIVLFGAALHAGWNAIVKSGADTLLDTVLVTLGAAAVSAAAIPFLPAPAPASWPFVAASTAIHVAYWALVAAAYRSGDMSHAYPLMRGSAPLLVALASAPLLGEALSLAAWLGVLTICAGILALALAGRPSRHATLYALGNAVVIAAYTLVDGTGARLSGNAVSYITWKSLFTAAPMLALALCWRGGAAFAPYLAARWRMGLLGGACSVASYGLALWAMTKTPIAVVAALRETSILFAIGFAALLLGERVGAARAAAAAVVLGGVVALRLG